LEIHSIFVISLDFSPEVSKEDELTKEERRNVLIWLSVLITQELKKKMNW